MKIFRLASSSETLDYLEQALRFVLEKGEWKTVKKSKLMPIGVLKEYGVLEMFGENVNFSEDRCYLKLFYEVWSGEYNGYGVGKPKNVPVYRGFIEGIRQTPWPKTEEENTHKDKYGPFSKLVDLSSPERVGMSELGRLESLVGKPIDVANAVKALIDKWGDDNDFEVEDVTVPSPPSEALVHADKKYAIVRTAANLRKSSRWGLAGAGVLYFCPFDNTVLLLKRSRQVEDAGLWGIPGGAVKGVEDWIEEDVEAPEYSEDELRDSAYSEVDEEIGHLPEHEKEQGFHTTVKDNFKYTTFLSVVNQQQKQSINNSITLNWESDDFSWFNVHSLPQNIHPGVVSAVQNLIQESIKV